MVLTTDYTDKKFTHEDQGCRVRQVLVDAICVSIPIAHFVISSPFDSLPLAQGKLRSIENGAAGEAATYGQAEG